MAGPSASAANSSVVQVGMSDCKSKLYFGDKLSLEPQKGVM